MCIRDRDGYGMGGILADDMGLGKTLQVLSYLLALKEGGQPLQMCIRDRPSSTPCAWWAKRWKMCTSC